MLSGTFQKRTGGASKSGQDVGRAGGDGVRVEVVDWPWVREIRTREGAPPRGRAPVERAKADKIGMRPMIAA